MIQSSFRKLSNKTTAEQSKRFFKTKKGEYGFGDQFLGITMPEIRKFAQQHSDLTIEKTIELIRSPYHEERMLGLILLINQFKRSKTPQAQQAIYEVYVNHFQYINNWDLVDVSCPHIVGRYLMDKDRSILYTWAKSDHLWTRRIAIVSTLWFIRQSDFEEVLSIAEILLNDHHDLIHKAVGWMLREAGKIELAPLEYFLKKHYQSMPRTMLRYAIERFPEDIRKKYLKGEI